MGNRQNKSQSQNKNSAIRMNKSNTGTATATITDAESHTGSASSSLNASINSNDKAIVNITIDKSLDVSNGMEIVENKEVKSEQEFFDWPVLSGFVDLKGEKSRFQLGKNKLDKTPDLDVNKIIGGIAETSKREDKQISKENRLDEKRLHKIADGREQINNQDSLNENLSKLAGTNSSTSTGGNISKGENQESIASEHLGKPKLSRRAKARANRVSEQNDERGVLHSVDGSEVNGKPSEVVQGAVPYSDPLDENNVESNLQLAKVGSSELSEMDGSKLPSDVNEQGFAKGMVSNTPASEGKGSLDNLDKQIGTAESKGVQSLSVYNNEKNVMKNASKGFFVLFSEKTDEILSPLSFVAHNHIKMAMAILQLFIPLLLTYLLVTNVTFIASGIASASLPFKVVLYFIFYIGCLCASIFFQVIGSGIKVMFIKAFIDAAAIGENKT